MNAHVCIHGHFYQPPREDPWLGEVPPEGSAAPGVNWNERICRECYAPLAFARLLGDDGITGIVNVYEWISFNFGPTLLRWMESEAPEVYERVLEADKRSRSRLGFGNAMAQVAHHVILPLANREEKRLEVTWAMDDFESRYGRVPDGMWLAETAVDTETLEVLAEEGIAYTVLAPRQAEAVLEGGQWIDVDEGSLDVARPYRVDLPSGRSICVFFYNGGISQAVAFENLLADGDAFWHRVKDSTVSGLLSLATDGETYGHHFKFGEMALAYVLHQADSDPDVILTNYAAYLAAFPPQAVVRIREQSSWSCVHGVERWRADCGCNAEGRHGWNQQWRKPLREALRNLKEWIDSHYEDVAPKLFHNAESVLYDYGQVVCGSYDLEAFGEKHLLKPDSPGDAWQLLEMKRHAQAMFASCAWFFDDLDRIEPINAMSNALRAMELADETSIAGGMAPLLDEFRGTLTEARANASERNPGGLDGWTLFERDVLPRRETDASLVAQALLWTWVDGGGTMASSGADVAWPCVCVSFDFTSSPGDATAAGTAKIMPFGGGERSVTWEWKRPSTNPLQGSVRVDGGQWFEIASLPWPKQQFVALEWVRMAEEAQWERERLQVQAGRELILPRTESQIAQNDAWRWEKFWAVLAWEWIAGNNTRAEYEALVKEAAPGAAEREALTRRVVKYVAKHISLPEPDWAGLEALIERVKAVLPDADLWRVQNALWIQADDSPRPERFARLVGFAPNALQNR